MKIIRVTNKGQISIPIEIRNSVGISEGDDLIIAHSEGKICIEKIKKEKFKDLLKHSENVAKKLWSNNEDEIWNNI